MIDIDAALDNLTKRAKPGETFTDAEIAEACGVNRQVINYISSNALKKIRTHHAHRFDRSLIGYSQARQHQLSSYSHS